jgi:hypothetical protein
LISAGVSAASSSQLIPLSRAVEIFYVTRLPIASVLDDGMTLAETYDTPPPPDRASA